MLSIFAVPLLALSAVSASTPAARSTSPVIGAWYAGWHATEGFPLSSVSWGKYNTLYYSFATPTASVDSLSLGDSNGDLLPQFVSEAHANGVAAHVGVGGWLGSVWFSSSIATAENRTAFVKTVANFAYEYNLDGIQFDWEYPGRQGAGCNTISVNDTANFLEFLQEFRQNPVGANLTLSAAVSLAPFTDASGNPSADVSGLRSVGPNAPLNDTCASSANQQGSAVSAIKAWTAAGMPVNQIVLGVASYGHSFNVAPSVAFKSGTKHLAAYPAFVASKQPLGDAWDDTSSVDNCGVKQGPGGTFRFWGLIDNGFLTEEGKPADGIYYRYDNCSKTPYVYNETSQVMVSFDNPKSLAAKGKFIKETGLRGFTMWEAAGDYNNMLLHSISKAMGH
ncbi:glycoside hydrolase family 18 protein [Suillus lakei]|nr:glycoside hydrolase family 18 protein [Suillus lakei]